LKIKNLLMQWLILTPLTFLTSMLSIAIALLVISPAGSGADEVDPFALIIGVIIILGILLALCKLLLRIKGRATVYDYWDSEFVYELHKNTYNNNYTPIRVKGGWTSRTKMIVWVYFIMSPTLIFLQLIANIFAFISLFSKRIASWYGGIDYGSLSAPVVQNVIHFLFSFVILPRDYVLTKSKK